MNACKSPRQPNPHGWWPKHPRWLWIALVLYSADVVNAQSTERVTCARLMTYWEKPDIFLVSKVPIDPSFDASLPTNAPYDQPNNDQIRAAMQAESACIMPNPKHLPLTDDLRANLAAIGHVARHMPARYTLSSDADPMLLYKLRSHGRFTPEAIFATTCELGSAAYRKRMGELIPGQAAVIDTVAWVPLLTPKREFAGPGLLFVYDGTWKYSGLSYSLGAPEAERHLERSEPDPYRLEEHEEFFARCPLPEAPEPEPWIEDYSTPWLAGFAEKDKENSNLLGIVKRLAVRRMASAHPAAMSTQLIYAEVLLRSLDFDGAPRPGTRLWMSRVTYFQKVVEDALSSGAELHRIAPLIRWLGTRHLVGEPGFTVDFAKASYWLKIATEFGDHYAEEINDSITSGEIEHCEDFSSLPDGGMRLRSPEREPESKSELLRPCDERKTAVAGGL